jgi:hypothetical protein
MFRDITRKAFLGLITITLCALALQENPAAAQEQQKQTQRCGYATQPDGSLVNATEKDGRLIIAEYSAPCARYYAPYAIMAAAVYLDVSKFEDKHRKMSDAELALSALGLGPLDTLTDDDKTLRDYAKTLMRGWSYKFGSEGYIDCLHNKDQAYPEDEPCKAASPWRYSPRRFSGSYRGPAFNVWVHKLQAARCNEVSIAFRGTTGFADYVSSGYRFTGWVVDTEYHQLQRNIDAIIGRIAGLPSCYNRQETQIVSVGHSLGAGLAELAAFAPRTGPRIAKVFAFNPSSESGHTLVDQDTLDKNVGSKDEKGSSLEVDIVYQPGEAAEQLREIDPQFPLNQPCNPLVRTVRFDVIEQTGFVDRHVIRGKGAFAYGIVKTSRTSGQPLSAPPSVGNCPTRYHPPGPEEEEQISPTEQTVYAPDGSLVRSARLNRQKASNLFASAPSVDNTNWMWTGDRLVTTPPTAKNGRRAHTAHL